MSPTPVTDALARLGADIVAAAYRGDVDEVTRLAAEVAALAVETQRLEYAESARLEEQLRASVAVQKHAPEAAQDIYRESRSAAGEPLGGVKEIAMDDIEIDTTNDSLVFASGDQIVIMRARTRLTKPEAMRLAAWLVALADDNDAFPVLLDAVRST